MLRLGSWHMNQLFVLNTGADMQHGMRDSVFVPPHTHAIIGSNSINFIGTDTPLLIYYAAYLRQ